jgi:hypothetical protein
MPSRPMPNWRIAGSWPLALVLMTDRERFTERARQAAAGGGRGLRAVHQLCDLVEVRTGPGGTTTRPHMRLTA